LRVQAKKKRAYWQRGLPRVKKLNLRISEKGAQKRIGHPIFLGVLVKREKDYKQIGLKNNLHSRERKFYNWEGKRGAFSHEVTEEDSILLYRKEISSSERRGEPCLSTLKEEKEIGAIKI